jgi:tetratricopeptide (TPR) repeat protein
LTGRTRILARAGATALALAFGLAGAPSGGRDAQASSTADELVRQARAHEAAHEDDVALRRYTDALAVDRASVDAWLGLGALRMKLGEPAEAERVFDTALAEIPGLHEALRARAHARWVLGSHAAAEDDLASYALAENDAKALRELADWFGSDGRFPAQLATWRQVLDMARDQDDSALERDATRMIRALVVLVGTADPAASPFDPDATRRALAHIAARGG